MKQETQDLPDCIEGPQIDIFESASVGDSELYNTSPEAKNK